MGKYVRIQPDGTTTVYVTEDKQPKLEKLQELVGGYIERIKVKYDGKTRDAYLDEEGLIKVPRAPVNEPIMRLAALHYTSGLTQPLVGNAVIWVPDSKKGQEEV
jgi:Domain of unknown function (DUF3846)